MPRKSTGRRPDGRWMFQATHPETKKRHTVYGRTRTEAQEKLAALKASFKTGQPLPDEQQTVQTYLDSWLKIIKTRVDESTWLKYEMVVRLHLAPALGSLLLPKLTALRVQEFYTAKSTAGLAPATIRHFHAVLHHALKDAVRLQLLEKNVADYVEKPRPARHTVKALSEEETRALLEASAEDRLHALFVLAVKVGLREGELLALHWTEINLAKRLLEVKYGLQRRKIGYALDAPKSEYSERTITLPPSTVDALKAHKERQAWEKRRAGSLYHDSGLVFCDEAGGRFTPRQLWTRFQVYVTQPPEKQRTTKRGPRPMLDPNPVLPVGTTFHHLRKTARTRMAERGIDPNTSAAILGHGVAVSLELYTKVTPRMKQQAADLMDEDFG